MLNGILLALALGAAALRAEAPPIDVRVENLTVLPSTGPLAGVLVRNHGTAPARGRIEVRFPAGWKLNKTVQEFALQSGELRRLSFAVEKGSDDPANSYPVQTRVQVGDASSETSQTIAVVTAPYFKPVIDGKREEWKDAVPVAFRTGGKQTTLATYWNSRAFSLLVGVEEDRWTPLQAAGAAAPFDAVQFALAPREAQTPDRADAPDQRYEFLLAGKAGGGACFRLYPPDRPAEGAGPLQSLAGLELAGAALAVTREGGWTYYECSIPFKSLPLIQPDPGREICFSLLVHDPGGTGLRDWGEAARLWPDQRKPLAWRRWPGARWPERPPFDNKIELGFCSSIH